MKNAGMAGAVALVGIGLLSIGLSNFANRAEAVPSVSSGQSAVVMKSPSMKDRGRPHLGLAGGEAMSGGDARERNLGLPACDTQGGLFEGPFPVELVCSSTGGNGDEPGFTGGGNIGVVAGRPLRFESGYVSRSCDGSLGETDLLFGYREQSLIGNTLEFGWSYASIPVDSIAEELVSNTNWNAYQVQVTPYAWEDIDGDGLEDLVVRARANQLIEDFEFGGCFQTGGGVTREYWFRNLGFIVPDRGREGSQLIGDLNNDCEVSGADLGLLLVEYGNVCE
jgi:hypothetical protein